MITIGITKMNLKCPIYNKNNLIKNIKKKQLSTSDIFENMFELKSPWSSLKGTLQEEEQ